MAAQTKTAEKQVKIRAYTLEKGKPYGQLTANREHFAAWVIAAANVAGFVTLNKKSVGKSKTPGDSALLAKIIGRSATNTWKKKGLRDNAISVEALNEMNTRLAGGNAFATTVGVVKAMVAGIKTGKAIKLDDKEYKPVAAIK